jgi:anti-sigma B factor antagonist
VTLVVTPPAGSSGPRVVHLSGDVDVATVPDLLPHLPALAADAPGLVLELSEVSFLDSSGVRFVDRLGRACAQQGTAYRVVAPPGSAARRTLGLVGLLSIVDDDLQEASRKTG